MVVDYLLQLCMVCCVTLIVYASGVEPRAAHLPPSASDKNHLNFWRGLLLLNVALNYWYAPILAQLLTQEIFAHGVVQHVPCVDVAKLVFSHIRGMSLFLHASSKIDVSAKVRSKCDVFSDFFSDRAYLIYLVFSHLVINR